MTASTAPAPTKEYHPYGAAWRLLHCHAPEVLLSGPAGTGKSRACLTKLHFLCERVSGLRCLMVRRTRESLTESGLVTFEDHVLPEGHPVLSEGGKRRMRQSYRYPNGSEIVVGGLDKPGKIMSTEYDLIYPQEAIELTEDAWESLTTRLRNNRIPFQQLLADTNPDAPTHWLKKRCDAGKVVLLESRHEDNPRLWDRQAKAWTKEGVAYIARLEALTGPRYHRLRHGRWVQAEGVVYDGWDAALHLIDRSTPPAEWERYWSIDFGYTNPFVWQAWAKDADGRLHLYREIYRTKGLVEDHARMILAEFHKECAEAAAGRDGKQGIEALKRQLRPKMIVCDHDREGRATLDKHLGMQTTAAVKDDKDGGIQAVAARLRKADDGKPRMYLMRGTLVHRADEELAGAKKPTCTAEEFDGYVWNTAGGRRKGEEPVKENDHGMDALRYLCATLDKPKRRMTAW